MENSASEAPEIELTPENWIEKFGEDAKIETPIGEVKVGENQYFKLAQQGRDGKLGMIKLTLVNPDVIIKDYRPDVNGNSERDTSYIFIRTFVKSDGSRYYYFSSVTVLKDGKEVVISSQEKGYNKISRLLQNGNVVLIKDFNSLHPKAQIEESIPLNDSNELTNVNNQSALLGINSSVDDSYHKDNNNQTNSNELDENNSSKSTEKIETESDSEISEQSRMVRGVLDQMGFSEVTVIDHVSQIPESEQAAIDAINQGRTVKGWFDPSTGKSFIYTPNATTIEDIKETLWHEVVAHHGMRELFGKEGYNKLLDKVWDSMSLDAKAEMFAYIAAGRRELEDTRENRRAAADEYVARIAEGGVDDATVWDKIKKFVQEFANKLGLNVDVTDADIQALLRASYSNLHSKGATQSIKRKSNNDTRFRYAKTPEEFDAIQREAVEKKGIVAPNLNSASVEIVDAPEHGFRNFAEAKAWAKSNIAKTYSDAETGGKGEIKISNTTIDKYFAEKAVLQSDSKDIHQRVVRVLPEIIKTAIEAEIHPDYKKVDGERRIINGINENLLIHRLYASVRTEDGIFRVKITLKEDFISTNPVSAYSYEATKIELLAGTLGNPASSSLSPNTSNSISVAKLLKGVDKSYDKGKKLLDESEEVLFRAVYHGSPHSFDKFDHSFMGTGEGAQAFGWGTYVTEVEGIGRTYAKIKDNDSVSNEGNRNLYNVEIPDNNGSNYLMWDDVVEEDIVSKVSDMANSMGYDTDYMFDRYDSVIDQGNITGDVLYNMMADTITDFDGNRITPQITSEILNKTGFVGVSYPAEATRGGRFDNARNYVIFNESDLRIDDHIRFRLTEEEQQIIDNAGDNAFKAPNGEPTKLNRKQWAQVRTKAFKEWFGDWEKAARIKKLLSSESIEISGDEYKGKYELTPKSASRYILDNIRGAYTNKDTGEIINVSRKGAEKVVSHDKDNEAHLKSVVAIPQLLENAIFITEERNSKSSSPYESYRYYVTGLKIGEENYTVKLAIGVLNGETYYDHSLTEIEKADLINSIDSLSIEFAKNQTDLLHLKDKRLLSILQTNSSKVVDENGEPLVVYHGSSSNNITEFDRSQSTREPSSLKEFGHFFTTNEEIAQMYADLPMRQEIVDKIDAEINNLREQQDQTRNNRDYYAIEDAIDMLEAQKDGRVYQTFLNLRDMHEVDAEGKTFYEGRQNLSVPLSYKRAIGIDAIEALAGENSMDKSVKVDGIKMSNVIEMSIGSNDPELLKRYFAKYGGDSYQVFDAINIKSATDNNGEFSEEYGNIYFREDVKWDNGKSIAFKNYPVKRVAKGVENYLNEKDVEYRKQIAKTGSTYINFVSGNAEFELRISNHTSKRHNNSYPSLDFILDGSNNIADVNIDVQGEDRYLTEDLKNIILEVEKYNGSNKIAGSDKMLPSIQLGVTEEEYPYIYSQLSYSLDYRFLAMLDSEINKEYQDEVRKRFGEIQEPYAATNGAVVDNSGNVYLNGKRLTRRRNKELVDAAINERREKLALYRSQKETFPYSSFKNEWLKNSDYILEKLPSRDDIRYREDVNEKFNAEIKRYELGEMKKSDMFHLGLPQGVMSLFLPQLPIVMRQGIVRKGIDKKHNVSLNELLNLPSKLSSPIFVFQRSENEIGILTEIKNNEGKNVCVAVVLNKTIQDGGAFLEVNDVRSFHEREIDNIIKPINFNNTLKWVDKEKGLDWITSALHNFKQAQSKQNLSDEDFSSAAKIVESFVNPTLPSDNNINERGSSAATTPSRADIRKMEQHAKSQVERLNLDNVEILTSTEGLEGKERKAKGIYRKSTGKITIVVQNNRSVEDIEQTILHEAVAHYGLRRLFGDHFEEFLDKVYANVDLEVRKKITDLAAKNDWDFRKATEIPTKYIINQFNYNLIYKLCALLCK